MKFTKIDELPKRVHAGYKRREEDLMAFLAMNTRYAKVDYSGDHNSPESARASIQILADRHSLPIRAYMINGEVYLENLAFAKEDEE